MAGPDIGIAITWDVKTDTLGLYSNAKDEVMEELLTTFLHDQALKGTGLPEHRTAQLRGQDNYTIKIGLWLEDDHFQVEHDCGNTSLMLGIAIHALALVAKNDLRNQPLAAWKK